MAAFITDYFTLEPLEQAPPVVLQNLNEMYGGTLFYIYSQPVEAYGIIRKYVMSKFFYSSYYYDSAMKLKYPAILRAKSHVIATIRNDRAYVITSYSRAKALGFYLFAADKKCTTAVMAVSYLWPCYMEGVGRVFAYGGNDNYVFITAGNGLTASHLYVYNISLGKIEGICEISGFYDINIVEYGGELAFTARKKKQHYLLRRITNLAIQAPFIAHGSKQHAVIAYLTLICIRRHVPRDVCKYILRFAL